MIALFRDDRCDEEWKWCIECNVLELELEVGPMERRHGDTQASAATLVACPALGRDKAGVPVSS